MTQTLNLKMKDPRLREGRDLPQITQHVVIEKNPDAGSLDPILMLFPLLPMVRLWRGSQEVAAL